MAKESTYTKEIAFEICDIIATSNKGLHSICESDERFPTSATFYNWLHEQQELIDKYARAREAQADFLADEILEIADYSAQDTKTIISKGGGEYEAENTEWVNRSKLRVEARKWIAAKLRPKKYGDKIDIEAQHNHTVSIVFNEQQGNEPIAD